MNGVAHGGRLQVVVSAGPEDLPRAIFALETALAAVASGVAVGVFLVLSASRWACVPRRNTGQRVYDLIDQLEALGARLVCCSACAELHCTQPPGEHHVHDETPMSGGVATAQAVSMRVGGLTAFLEGVIAGVPTLTM